MNTLPLEPVLIYRAEELLKKTGWKRSTFYYRLNALGIVPDFEGYYTQDDLEILKSLDAFLKNCPSIKMFKKVRGLR